MEAEANLKAQVRSNALKSVLLLAGFPFVLPLVSFFFVLFMLLAFGQRDAFATAGLTFWYVLAFVGLATIIWLPIGYALSQSIIDDATGARLVGRHEELRLWALMEDLCRRAGMRLPALRIIETEVLNAFASGLREGQYSVAVTRGLMNELNDEELKGVLAHELTHIRNSDCRLLVVATILVGLVPLLHEIVVRWFWMMVVTFLNIYRAIFSAIPVPMAKGLVTVSYTLMYWAGKGAAYLIGTVGHFCSLIIHFSLSRKREFMADAGAVELTGNPEAMISALRRVTCNSTLETKVEGIREMLFDNPLAGLFATHPPVEQRIEAIERYVNEQNFHVDRLEADATPPLEAPASAAEPKTESMMEAETEPHTERGADPAENPESEPPSEQETVPATADRRMINGYRRTLLRAMDGSPETVDRETRQKIYRRARTALRDRLLALDPLPPADELEQLEGALETAIDEIEAQALTDFMRRRRLSA